MSTRVGHTGKFRWTSASATHVGTVRALNEDSCLELPERPLWAVADGMGGHEAGDFASQSVLDSLRQLPQTETLEDAVDKVVENLKAANAELRHYASVYTRSGIVGTTVAIVLGSDTGIACLWAGDSRIYLVRDGQIRQLTKDHSQVQELISLGRLDTDEAKSHPSAHVITRAVGAAESLDVDVASHAVRDGDILLICSDGLIDAVPDDRILELVDRTDCGAAVNDLLQAALESGATDNVTVIVVCVQDAVG